MLGKKCGTCGYAKMIDSQDFTKRLCHGAPPTTIQVPAPHGQMTFKMARPIISVTDDACALYRERTAIDIVTNPGVATEEKRMPTHDTKQ